MTQADRHRIKAARERLVLCRLMIDLMRNLHGSYAPATEPFGNRLETFFIGLCVAVGQFAREVFFRRQDRRIYARRRAYHGRTLSLTPVGGLGPNLSTGASLLHA